jgi:hypothetical protein
MVTAPPALQPAARQAERASLPGRLSGRACPAG